MSPRKAPGLLAVGDDLGDRLVGAADLRQVGAAEGVGGAGHLDDDHLHQLRVVAVGVDDEAGDRRELVARASPSLRSASSIAASSSDQRSLNSSFSTSSLELK